MKLPSTRLIAFNAVAVIFFVGAVVSVFKDFLIPPTLPPCSPRYLTTTGMSLEQDGRLLTIIDIQAAAHGRDRGLTDSATVTRIADAPAPAALLVRLARGTGVATVDAKTPGGISFPWLPRSAQNAGAACLVYDVRLPADFDFGSGGTLPGLIGAANQTALMSDGPDGFALPVQWGEQGRMAMQAKARIESQFSISQMESFRGAMPRGRWVRIEQEVILNTPGASDGTVRLWIDGKLRVETGGLSLRAGNAVAIAGVSMDVHHGAPDQPSMAPRDQEIELTPFELRLK